MSYIYKCIIYEAHDTYIYIYREKLMVMVTDVLAEVFLNRWKEM